MISLKVRINMRNRIFIFKIILFTHLIKYDNLLMALKNIEWSC